MKMEISKVQEGVETAFRGEMKCALSDYSRKE
jgi:hypothetical protein